VNAGSRIAPAFSATRPEPAASSGRPRPARGRLPSLLLLVAAVYLALAFVQFWPAWSHGPSHWLQFGGQADGGQAVFFLAQFPAALLHGVNPFANSWTNWPEGANYMANTAFPLLALIMAPVTLASSPILSLNLLFTLAVWADCLVAYLVVQHFVRHRGAAFVAGLVFGFSPMVTAGAYSHVHVVFDLLAPVMFLLLWRLCTGVGEPTRNGVLLGLAMAAQLYVFSEPLGDCAVIAAVGLAVAAWVYRHQLSPRFRPFLRGALVAVGTFVVLGGFGIYIQLAGPQHVKGSPHQGTFYTLTADLLGPLLPTNNQRFSLGLGRTGSNLTGVIVNGKMIADGAENGAYIGIPLLTLLIAGVVWQWRRPLVRWAAGLASVSIVFSLGPRLRIDDHTTPVHLPFDVLAHLPLLRAAVPSRFAMEEWWFLALLVGVILAELHRSLQARTAAAGPRHRGRLGRFRADGTVLVVALVALLPLVPAWPYSEGPVPLPSLAVSSVLRSRPTGQVLLGYPFPTANTYLMVFQAEDRMRFRLVGGSLIQPAANGENLTSAAPPSTCQSVLNEYYQSTQPVELNATTMASCAAEMVAWNVRTVLWTDLGLQSHGARAFFTDLLGPATRRARDSALWLDPQPALRRVVAGGGAAAMTRAGRTK
jgi:hypothetical protein